MLLVTSERYPTFVDATEDADIFPLPSDTKTFEAVRLSVMTDDAPPVMAVATSAKTSAGVFSVTDPVPLPTK